MVEPHASTRSGRDRNTGPKRPIVIFAPYPPSTSGIAAYLSELMPHHLAEFDVTLVLADDAVVPSDDADGPRILLASEFRKHREFFESAPKLYHIGNNPDHCYMLDFLARDPGIVVLHDFVLNYLHDAATLGWQKQRGYCGALEAEYGSLGSDDARFRFERADRGQFATYELSLNGDVLEAATGVIAHSRYVQYKVAARVPRTPVWYVPHYLSPAVAEYGRMTKIEARRELGLPENELIVTALGFVTYAKRVGMLLSALAELRGRIRPFLFVLAGQQQPEQFDVEAAIAALGLKAVTRCTGYIDDSQFFKHLAACDVVANLRHPSGGESSGTLVRALGMGAPTVVFDHGTMGELPDAVVRKVAWNSSTQEELTNALYELLSDQPRRLALGGRAAAYARTVHGIERIARRYSEIIAHCEQLAGSDRAQIWTQHFASPRVVARRFRQIVADSGADRPPVDGVFWWRCATAPLGQTGHRALVVAPSPGPTAQFLSSAFEWDSASLTAMTLEEFGASSVRDREGASLRMESFEFALAVVPARLPENRAAMLLRRLNAAVRRGGSVVLEVWSELDQEESEAPLAEERLPQCLIDAGFAGVGRAAIQDAFLTSLVAPGEHDAGGRRFTCFKARKASSFAVWRIMDDVLGIPSRLGGRVG